MDPWVPQQVKAPTMHDYRFAVTGPRGYKLSRKRKLEETDLGVDQQMVIDSGANEKDVPRSAKKAKHNIVGLGKSSGRPWKEPGERAGTLRNANLSTSWETKMQQKEQQTKFRELKQAVIEARRQKLQGIRKQKEAAKARKQENREKSLVTQTISKPATVKRMLKSKKGRKLLRKADVTVVEP
eukprot:jgi/Botrbrau1/886/Bobra.0167s0010.1